MQRFKERLLQRTTTAWSSPPTALIEKAQLGATRSSSSSSPSSEQPHAALSSAPRPYLSLGQFCPRAFRMASVMLQQPEAHSDCSLWHPLHIVMRPSSVICYKKNNNTITRNNRGVELRRAACFPLGFPTRDVTDATLCFSNCSQPCSPGLLPCSACSRHTACTQPTPNTFWVQTDICSGILQGNCCSWSSAGLAEHRQHSNPMERMLAAQELSSPAGRARRKTLPPNPALHLGLMSTPQKAVSNQLFFKGLAVHSCVHHWEHGVVLTKHVWRFNVTNSGQFAPMYLRASSSSWEGKSESEATLQCLKQCPKERFGDKETRGWGGCVGGGQCTAWEEHSAASTAAGMECKDPQPSAA